ncbi:MAG: hypothetical protein A7315_03140 [Candidatus Altiarchaeales archaeon WOR_SM1_79]|nr:MAG: hypothetical protein A7315_03140 [Candidatus Altiarchaeales archaeon WOR_SM1_79]
MNTSKLIGLIPEEGEIRNIKQKYARISAYAHTARCLALTKDKNAEEFIGNALIEVNGLHEKEIGRRALAYARCAESYSIMGSKHSTPTVNAAIKEIMKAKPTSSILDHDKIIISISRSGVNLNDIKIIGTARQLCDRIYGRTDFVPAFCSVAECYAHLGETEKALETVHAAQDEVLRRRFDKEKIGCFLTDIAVAIVKIGEIANDAKIIAKYLETVKVLREITLGRTDGKVYENVYGADLRYLYAKQSDIRVTVAAANALINIGWNDNAWALMEMNRNFWDNDLILNLNNLIELDVFGIYTFETFLNIAYTFYGIDEKEKSKRILRHIENYLFDRSYFEQSVSIRRVLERNISVLIKMALLWGEMNDENANEIINEIYDRIKDTDVDERAFILSEILSSIQS